MREQRGATLIELLVAATIAFFVIWSLIAVAHHLSNAAARLDARVTAESASDALLERLRSDAASAWAIWSPNASEVDFSAEDSSQRTYTWAYRFAPDTQTVTRYAIAPDGSAEAGETWGPLAAFATASYAPAALADPGSPAYDPLFAGASVPEYRYGNAGNDLVRVSLTWNGAAYDEILESTSAPSHFTIVVNYTPSPAPLGTPIPTPLPVAPITPAP